MKKITIIMLVMILLFIHGCGTKVPYKSQTPLKNASLVYIYTTVTNNFGENLPTSTYQVHINNKRIKQTILYNEYMPLDFNTNKVIISVTRAQIEEHSLKLNLENGKTYYLRVKANLDDGGFKFEEVKKSIGMQEIVKTVLAGSVSEDKATKITEVVETDKKSYSKIDEIKKAHNLKEQGVISNEEFEVLKAEILAK